MAVAQGGGRDGMGGDGYAADRASDALIAPLCIAGVVHALFRLLESGEYSFLRLNMLNAKEFCGCKRF